MGEVPAIGFCNAANPQQPRSSLFGQSSTPDATLVELLLKPTGATAKVSSRDFFHRVDCQTWFSLRVYHLEVS